LFLDDECGKEDGGRKVGGGRIGKDENKLKKI